jgi:hypothetical protein
LQLAHVAVASSHHSIEDKLNNRPRKALGYRTPQEVFDEMSHQLFFVPATQPCDPEGNESRHIF